MHRSFLKRFQFCEIPPKFASLWLLCASLSFGIGSANAQFASSSTNTVSIEVPTGFVEVDMANNFAYDVDFARGQITMEKSSSSSHENSTVTLTGSGVAATPVASSTVTWNGDDFYPDADPLQTAVTTVTVTDSTAGTDATINGAGGPFENPVAFDAGSSVTASTLPTGTYTFTETLVAGAIEPQMVTIACTVNRPTTGTPGSTVAFGSAAASALALGTTTFDILSSGATNLPVNTDIVNVALGAGEDVSCVITNVVVDIEITKSWREGSCSTAAPVAPLASAATAGTDSENATTPVYQADNSADVGTFGVGANGCYTVEIKNNGQSATSSAFAFTDSLFNGSALLTGISVTGASCTAADTAIPAPTTATACGLTAITATTTTPNLGLAGGSGTTIQAGGTVTLNTDIAFASDFDVSLLTGGELVNRATVLEPYDPDADTAGELWAELSITPVRQADLALNKTDGISTYVPGSATVNTYTVNACNHGPTDVVGAVLSDVVPSGITQQTGVNVQCVASTVLGLGANAPAKSSSTGTYAASSTAASASSCPVSFTAGATYTATLDLTVGNCVSITMPYTVDQ